MENSRWGPIIIFFIIGILLLIIAFLVAVNASNSFYYEFIGNAISTAAFVFLTVALIDIFWTFLGGNPLENLVARFHGTLSILSDSHETGLRRFRHASGSLWNAEDWITHLTAAEHQVELMGHTLHVWSRSARFEEKVVALVKRGVHMRVLNMHPDNPNFSSVVNQRIPGITKDSSAGEASGAEDLFRSIEQRVNNFSDSERRGSFQYRQVKLGTILCQVCRFDRTLTEVQYLSLKLRAERR